MGFSPRQSNTSALRPILGAAGIYVIGAVFCLWWFFAPRAIPLKGVAASGQLQLPGNPRDFRPQTVIDGIVLERSHPEPCDYWLLPQQTPGWIRLDFERASVVSEVQILNTFNGTLRDRATLAFELYLIGEDGHEQKIAADRLPFYPQWKKVRPNVNPDQIAAGIRLQVTEFYGSGGGLNELRVFGTWGTACQRRDWWLLSLLAPLVAAYLLARALTAGPWLRGPVVESIFLGIVPGVCVFLALFGTSRVPPTFVEWMLKNDPSINFLGWHFFRQEPWTLPPGLIHGYCAPHGTSIGYMDGIPLIAMPLKLFSGLLPDAFQYMGIWVLLCSALQGLFGELLTRTLTPQPLSRMLGAILFSLSTVFWHRAPGHFVLTGQWTLLAAIWLCVQHRSYLQKRWLLLIAVTSLVHTYLWAMVMALALADLGRLMIVDRTVRLRRGVVAVVAALGISAACQWCAGFFSIPMATTTMPGYSTYSANLTTLFNPTFGSPFFKPRPIFPGQNEGGAYLGAGVWLLCAWAVYGLATRRRRWSSAEILAAVPLTVIVLGLTAFALSNIWALDNQVVFCYRLPKLLEWLGGAFHGSGRFMWPVYYLVMFAALKGTIVGARPRATAGLLALAVLLQIVDRQPMVNYLRQPVVVTPDVGLLKSPTWEVAARKYRHLAMVPNCCMPHWEAFAFFAANHHMSFNDGRLPRYNPEKYHAAQRQLMQDVEAGNLEPETLYVFANPQLLTNLIPRWAGKYQVQVLDGFHVVFPSGLDAPEQNLNR